MSQQVLEPTRGKNILDLVITTNEGLIKNLQVGGPFSYHTPLLLKLRRHLLRIRRIRRFTNLRRRIWIG